MRKFGLIGKHISHSSSPAWFNSYWKQNQITDCSYELFSCTSLLDAENLLHNSSVLGFNVTTPYKRDIISYLNQIDKVAWELQAVNTLLKTSKESWKGFNTDMPAFRQTIISWYENENLPHTALILGSGGAASAVNYALKSLGIQTSIISSSGKGDYSYSEMDDLLARSLLVVQCTPVGMSPNSNATPDFPFARLTEKHRLYDLIYNPAETLFLARGKQMGAMVKNGFEMLTLQAKMSWDLWESVN